MSKYKIKADRERRIGKIDKNIYGHFIEHLGRCIYGGIYEEESPLSDEDGFRKDVLEAVKKNKMSHLALAWRELCLKLPLGRWNWS